jgi:hypothetical protein
VGRAALTRQPVADARHRLLELGEAGCIGEAQIAVAEGAEAGELVPETVATPASSRSRDWRVRLSRPVAAMLGKA